MEVGERCGELMRVGGMGMWIVPGHARRMWEGLRTIGGWDVEEALAEEATAVEADIARKD